MWATFIAITISHSFAKNSDAIVQELFETLEVQQEFNAEIDKGLEYLIESNISLSAVQDQLKDYTKKNLSWNHLEPEIRQRYKSLFTKTELKGLVEFFKTPAGKKYAQVGPALTIEIAQITQRKARNTIESFFKQIEARAPSSNKKELTVLEKMELEETSKKSK